MRENSQLVAPFVVSITMWLCMAASAQANPLCATPEQHKSVQLALSASPKSTPAQIARQTGIAEAAVVQGLPTDSRVPVAVAEFDGLWQRLAEWDDALLVALSSESVFEMSGPLPEGSTDGGYFNFDDSDSPYAGRLKIDRLGAIYLLSTDGRNGETHQAAFFDDEGRRVFSVYVPRDDERALKTQPHNHFLRMKQNYDAISRRSLLTDTNCLWSTPIKRETTNTEEGGQ